MAENESDFGVFLVGFIVGSLVGAVTALLLAPQSGEQTRLIIKDKGIELKNKASTTADQLKERGQELYTEQKSRVETAITSVKKPKDLTADEPSEV
jgi:gas vesicle protein